MPPSGEITSEPPVEPEPATAESTEPPVKHPTGAYVVYAVVFVVSYIYCIARYGFLLGLGLGWLPSGLVASLATALWFLSPFLGVAAAVVELVVIAALLVL